MRTTILSALFLAFFTSPAHAYLSVAESGELVEQGLYQVGLEPQFYTNNGGGTNLNLFLDAGLSDSTSARMSFGVGETDLNLFGSVKFVPFPDVDRQPAIGVRLGAGFTKESSENMLNFQVAPLLSKKVEMEDFGILTPYLSVPVTFIVGKDNNHTASNLVIGTEAIATDRPELKFGAELGFEMNKSYSYISFFLTYPFEGRTK